MTARGDRGTLILVVGPSGAGKDTLIAGAKGRLEVSGRFYFPQRFITRPAAAGGENHIAVGAEDFSTLAGAGRLALAWEAHGLSYGLPSDIAAVLEGGRHVIANASRSIIAEAQKRFAPTGVIYISVPAEELKRRLAARGRESEAEIAERLSAPAPDRLDTGTILVSNTGTVEDGVNSLLQAIHELVQYPPQRQ